MMIRRMWDRYMADVRWWEQHARETGDYEMLEMVVLFKNNRIIALCMACFMLIFATLALLMVVTR